MQYAGVALSAWLTFALISIFLFIATLWVRRVLSDRLSVLASRTRSTLDDLVVDLIRASNSGFLLVAALYVGSFALSLKPRTWTTIGAIAAVALLFQIGLWGNRVTDQAAYPGALDPDMLDRTRKIVHCNEVADCEGFVRNDRKRSEQIAEDVLYCAVSSDE